VTNQFPEGSLGFALEQEHHQIDAGIEAYTASLAQPNPDTESLQTALQALRRHIYLEEDFLFPGLTGDPSLPMAIFVMYREHGQIWRQMDTLEKLILNPPDTSVLRGTCNALLDLLQKHNFKEEPVIYGKADAILAAQLNDSIREFMTSGSMPAGWTCKKCGEGTTT
jgi:hemerythrin-like domain-containing protein